MSGAPARLWSPTERVYQQTVLDAARLLGWRCYHPWTEVHSSAGWPDLFLLRERDGRALAVELKACRGRLTPAQQSYLDALNGCGILAVAAWPADWDWLLALLQ